MATYDRGKMRRILLIVAGVCFVFAAIMGVIGLFTDQGSWTYVVLPFAAFCILIALAARTRHPRS